jgi:DNA replication protein DnaC
MNEAPLEPVGRSLIASLGALLAMVSGECKDHGQADVLVKAGTPWHCPRCFEAQLKADTEAKAAAERSDWLMKVATIPQKYIGARFTATTDAQRAVLRNAQLFRDFILKQPSWAALILVGITGTGKTLLSCQLGQALITKASRSVRYITAKGMIGEIQASYSHEAKTEEGEIMRFAQYDVLIIDEIDALPAKENSALLLTEIINRRYNENKPVIVISNQPFDNLAKFVGERVHSRLHENAFTCDFSWGDFRKVGQA